MVPVTPHLPELAQGWVTSKEDWVRLAGVLALGEFKSPANAATLAKMLHDPAWPTEQNPETLKDASKKFERPLGRFSSNGKSRYLQPQSSGNRCRRI